MACDRDLTSGERLTSATSTARVSFVTPGALTTCDRRTYESARPRRTHVCLSIWTVIRPGQARLLARRMSGHPSLGSGGTHARRGAVVSCRPTGMPGGVELAVDRRLLLPDSHHLRSSCLAA